MEKARIFRIGSCDCDESEKICQKEQVQKYPTFKIYPPYPIPAVDYDGPLNTQEILKFASKYLHNNVIEITESNIQTFITENPSVPKVLLFHEKKGTPLVYKGLSVEFEKKLTFGIIRKEEQNLVDRYNVKKFPKLIVVKANEKKPFEYKGEDFKFKALFEFLNVFSEVFVPGGGSSQDSQATKEWMTQLVPQLNQKSANDICLKVEGALCVIYINNGNNPDNSKVDELKSLHNMYQSKIDRGTIYKFMWLDGQKEQKWAEALGFKGEPRLVFLNPGKRKRYLVHDGEINVKSIKSTIEKIVGGDAKFQNLGNSLPEFTIMKD
ncbi:hypothetical protein pb186bvf_009242 [Paramecium bursaria]